MSHYIEKDEEDKYWEIYNSDDTLIVGGLTFMEAARVVNFLNGGTGLIGEADTGTLLAAIELGS